VKRIKKKKKTHIVVGKRQNMSGYPTTTAKSHFMSINASLCRNISRQGDIKCCHLPCIAKKRIKMRKLGKKYTYKIVGGATIFYKGQGDNIDFDNPYTLSEMCVIDKFAFDTLFTNIQGLEFNIQKIDKTTFMDIAPTLKNCIYEQEISKLLGLEKEAKNELNVAPGDIIFVAFRLSSVDNFHFLMVEVETGEKNDN